MKVGEIWERIKEGGALEGPETHAICKDDEILSEKEYLNKYKLKQNVCYHPSPFPPLLPLSLFRPNISLGRAESET